MYHDGAEGVPQNYGEALKWFKKAADQGDANAQTGLGLMYRSLQQLPPRGRRRCRPMS
jgi:uncharacterized protein